MRLVLDAKPGNPEPEAASKRQKHDLIAPLVVFACRPSEHDGLDCRSDRRRLPYQKQSWELLSSSDRCRSC